jgi:hypothetical protein
MLRNCVLDFAAQMPIPLQVGPERGLKELSVISPPQMQEFVDDDVILEISSLANQVLAKGDTTCR